MSEVVPAANGGGALMSFIERAAHDPEFDVQKFEVLLRLQMEVGDKQARRAFNTAMADAQAEMLPVVRDAANRHLGNKYAKLETIDAAARPIYTRHGFSVRFGSAPSPREGDMRITCTVAHSGGYFEENHLDAPLAGTGSQGARTATTPVQAVGSTVTYLRRYLLTMVFNIVLADEDDDGEAMRRTAAPPRPEPQVATSALNPYQTQQGLQAAAAAMPRGARIAEKAPQYEGPQDAPRKRQTIAEWLEAHRIALHDATSVEQVDAILESEEVQRARESFRNGAKTQLETMISEALAKWYDAPPEEPTNDEPEDLAALALP
jgi:hypothetical protein